MLLLTIIALLLAPAATFAAPATQGSGPTLSEMRRELGLGPLAAPTATADATYPVMASGLNNPRGLTFLTNGRLLVAEAGNGGDNCFNPDPADPNFMMCWGNTGAITAVDTRRGTFARLATGLPSVASPEGMEATGPHDVATRGSNIYALTGLGADPAARAMFGLLDFGYLWRIGLNGSKQKLVDVSAYESTANPDGGVPDSNPYSLVNLGGNRFVVADAGGNSLLSVHAMTGAISTVAVFPDRVVPVDPRAQAAFGLPPAMPAQSVPNSVAVGPDGALYVGELLGFPFTPGQSNVYRVVPGQAPTVYASGFSSIIDIAFDSDGSLYVLEMVKGGLLELFLFGNMTGALTKVDTQGNKVEIASEGLSVPGGVAVGPRGEIYVTNYSIFADMGQVLKIK